MAKPYVRVAISTLGEQDPIITAYAGAVAAMQAKPAKDRTSWTYQAAIHGTHVSSTVRQWNQCRHQTWYFVSWHRMYLYYFERIVRAEVTALGGPQDWALPYWDYDSPSPANALPSAFRSPTRPDGSPNPLYVAQRRTGINAGGGMPPEVTSPAFALGRSEFTGTAEFGGGITKPRAEFWGQTGRLEQTPHNDVHNTVGGLMLDPDTAAQDPIFWLHHANIDRIWWLWARHHSNPPEAPWKNQAFHFVDVGGTRASLTGAGVEDTVTQLGYTYDSTRISVAWPPPEPRRRPPVTWPGPWPERPKESTEPVRARVAAADRQLVGGTGEPVQLVGTSRKVTVPIDRRATESLATRSRGFQQLQHRAFLDIEDIEAERNPEIVYGVYVNLPDSPTPQDLQTHHVGNISLFGVERARNPRGDEPPHGLRVSMEITSLLDQLAHEGKWQDGGNLDVSFRPLTLEMPADADQKMAREIDNTDHAETPVKIGRVSIHYA